MKIREELAKKKRYVFMASVMGIAMIIFTEFMMRELKFEYSMFVGLGLFFLAILYSHYGIRCPKCRESMGHILMQLGSPLTISEKFKYCPYCGVSIDSEVEKKVGGLTTG